MAQVSNVQSRTLRVLGSLPESVKETLSKHSGVVLLEKESKNGGNGKSFITAENVSAVIDLLSKNNVTFRPHFYSLFAKFNTELKTSEVSKLNAKVCEISSGAGVSYSRVDENGHTGKVVVDRFEDYNALRSYEGEFTFYKFNRTKAQTRTTTQSQPVRSTQRKQVTEDEEGFTQVRRGRNNESKSYEQREGGRSRWVENKSTEQREGGRRVQREGARTTRGTGRQPAVSK